MCHMERAYTLAIKLLESSLGVYRIMFDFGKKFIITVCRKEMIELCVNKLCFLLEKLFLDVRCTGS